MKDLKEKRISRLSNWSINIHGFEDDHWYNLIGCIADDKDERFKLGDVVHTSMLLRIDFEKNIAETNNTIYHLV